jgi:hypothetical protein
MQLLLDTHIFYWTLYEQSKQPAMATKLMVEAESIFVSAASIWEIAIKVRLGKLQADIDELIANIELAALARRPVRQDAHRPGDQRASVPDYCRQSTAAVQQSRYPRLNRAAHLPRGSFEGALLCRARAG